VRLW